MKRRVPELYLNDKIDVDCEIQGNTFNQVLKQSLLVPQTERYMITRRERDEMEQQNDPRSLSSKKASLQRVRNISISDVRKEKDSLSVPRTLETRNIETEVSTSPECPRNQSGQYVNLNSVHSGERHLRNNKHSSIDVARMVMESEERTKPGRQNVGLSGRFYRHHQRPGQEQLDTPQIYERMNTQDR